ncbi:MAG: DUF4339 domain-containing protein [Pirellulaceae bacterium]|nr:DUF4339 domain-containing protein [Pirellulaceae bacterium]
MAKWFVTIEGREHGPLSDTELKRAVAKGRVTAETPVRKEGMDSSIPAARVKGLFAAAKDKTTQITPPPKKDEPKTTSDDGEELKLAETNWSPPAATPSNVPQQPPAAQAKKKKKPATFSIRALPRGLANILILLVLTTLFYLAGGLRGLALAMLIVYLFGPAFIVTLVNDFKIKNADHTLYIECGGLVGFVLIATLFCWLIPGDNDIIFTTLFFWTPQLVYYYILRAPHRSSSKPPVAKTRGWVDPIKQPPAPQNTGPRYEPTPANFLRGIAGAAAGVGCFILVGGVVFAVFLQWFIVDISSHNFEDLLLLLGAYALFFYVVSSVAIIAIIAIIVYFILKALRRQK